MKRANFSILYKGKLIIPSYLKQEKAQRVTALILTFITLSFFGLFAISPTLSTIAKLQKELSDSKDVDSKLQEKINNLVSLSRQYSTVQSDIPFITQLIPSSPNVPLLVAQIQAIAAQSSATVDTLQVSTVELTKGQALSADTKSFSFSLNASGNYTQLSDFVSRLIEFDRIITVDAVSISQTPGKATQLSLRGRAYFK